jgi:hypothetical protein
VHGEADHAAVQGISCAQIDTVQQASADDFQHRLHGSAAMHDVAFACPEPGGSFGGGHIGGGGGESEGSDGGGGGGGSGGDAGGGSGGGSGGGAQGEGGCMSKAHGVCARTEYATARLQLEKLLLAVLVGLPGCCSHRGVELKPDQGHANYM